MTPLGYVAHVEMGQSPPSDVVGEFGDHTVAFLQGNAEFGDLHPEPKKSCAAAPKHAVSGSILLSVRAPVGEMNIADSVYGIGRGLCAVTPDPSRCEPRYLWWALRASTWRLHAVATGSTYAAVSVDDVRALRLPIPSIGTQRRIADMLDTETARIDTLIDKNKRILSLLDERETSLITQAVMGEFALGSDPGPYPLVALRYLTSRIQAGVDFASSELSTEASDGLVRYVRTTDIEGISRLTETAVYAPAKEVPDTALAREGDLLVTRAGSLGTAYVHRGEPVAVAGYLVRVQFDRSSDPDFYGYWCRSRPFLDALDVGATQTTIQNFSASKYASMPTPAPSLETQRRVVSLLDAEMFKSNSLRSAVSRQQELLRLRRQALITAAVTGQI